MGGWRDEYTNLEWLQIGALLLGLPLAAVLGALVGLAGKWRQGRLASAVLLGIGSAAVASLMALTLFLIDAETSASRSSEDWIRLFDRYLSWRQTSIAIGAAGCISLIAAIMLRFRLTTESAKRFTLRSFIAAQVLAMVVLGCWTGMRTYVFSHVSPVERAAHRWANRGWSAVGTASNRSLALQKDFSQQPVDWKQENETLQEAIHEPFLGDLQLLGLGDAVEVDLASLAKAKNLKRLHLRYLPAAAPHSHIKALAKTSSLQYLTLQGGDFSSVDVSSLHQLQSITRIEIRDSTYNIPAMRTMIRDLKPESFEFSDSNPGSKMPTKIGFLQGGYSILLQSAVEPADLAWVAPMQIQALQIEGVEITTEAAREIARLPKLTSLSLNCRVEGDALTEVAKSPTLRSLYLLQIPKPISRDRFELAVNNLMLMTELELIVCSWDTFKPDLDFPKEANAIGVGYLRGADSAYFRNFAQPPTQKQIDYLKQVNDERNKRGLGRLRINPREEEFRPDMPTK
jgi:hypothetical protein